MGEDIGDLPTHQILEQGFVFEQLNEQSARRWGALAPLFGEAASNTERGRIPMESRRQPPLVEQGRMYRRRLSSPTVTGGAEWAAR